MPLLAIVLASLTIANSCGTKQEVPKTADDVQQTAPSTAAPAVAAPNSGDDIFKYTITTDIDEENDNIDILVAMNSVGGQYPVKYDLDCEGDGDFEYKELKDNKKCIYKKNSGTHQIWVRGEIPAMFLCARRPDDDRCNPEFKRFKNPLCDAPDAGDHSWKAVVSIDSWGNVSWKSMALFASCCTSLNKLPLDNPNLSQVKDMNSMFALAYSFNQPIEAWDVSNVTDMSEMFREARSFNQPLEAWDVSKVTDMFKMFKNASLFNQPLEKWNVSNVTGMIEMFANASSFNQPLDHWNVSNVTDMLGMFAEASSFNQPLEKWDVSNVTDMSEMFYGAESFNQSLENWNVSKVDNMVRMFNNATSFNQPLNKWDVSNVTMMGEMFEKATSFNQSLENWNVSNVHTMYSMFHGASSFNQPLENWNVSKVTDMRKMFKNAKAFSYYPKNWVVPADKSENMFTGTKVEEEAKKSPLKTK